MPDPSKKNPHNVAGRWFVDTTCIACDTCTDISPEIFGRDDNRQAYVKDQDGDAKLFTFAVESCPVEAVGVEE